MQEHTTEHQQNNDRAQRRQGQGFFVVDTAQFHRIRTKGLGIAEAAAYLALLVSTDQSNAESRGGINSVMNYTGLTRSYAKRAIENLEHVGFVEKLPVDRARARTVARYGLPAPDTRRRPTETERKVLEAIKHGTQPFGARLRSAAQSATVAGWLTETPAGWAIRDRANKVAFIPNAFARSTFGESQLSRLVNNGALGPLMLAVDIFERQDLLEHGGVPLTQLRELYRVVNTVTLPSHAIHEFTSGWQTDNGVWNGYYDFDCSSEDFWGDLRTLDRLHIIEWAAYSTNGTPSPRDSDSIDKFVCLPQRPLGVLRNGKQVWNSPEARPAQLAGVLQRLVATEGMAITSDGDIDKIARIWAEQSPIVAVENRAVEHVLGVGICRTVLRASTDATAAWFRELVQHCEQTSTFILDAIRTIYPQAYDLLQRRTVLEKERGAISILDQC